MVQAEAQCKRCHLGANGSHGYEFPPRAEMSWGGPHEEDLKDTGVSAALSGHVYVALRLSYTFRSFFHLSWRPADPEHQSWKAVIGTLCCEPEPTGLLLHPTAEGHQSGKIATVGSVPAFAPCFLNRWTVSCYHKGVCSSHPPAREALSAHPSPATP